MKLLIYHEIAPFFYLAVRDKEYLPPEKINNILSWSYYRSILNSQSLFDKYLFLYDLLQEKAIKTVPLKGIAFLYDLYGNFPAREMSDIDILIPQKDYQKAKKNLRETGYIPLLRGSNETYWKNKQRRITFRKNCNATAHNPYIEVHFHLDFKRQRKNTLPHLWENLKKIHIGRKKITVLSPENNLLSLALHQRKFGRPLCLKYVLDAALLLKKYGAGLDWDYIVRECRNERLRSCMYFFLLQCRCFMVTPDFDQGLKRLKPSKRKINAMQRFINNNLGSDWLFAHSKINFLKSHFLIYDDYLEPLFYIIAIPVEKFAEFYELPLGHIKTKILYELRFFYFVYRGIKILCQNKQA